MNKKESIEWNKKQIRKNEKLISMAYHQIKILLKENKHLSNEINLMTKISDSNKCIPEKG
jgi:hypothetical protein